MHHNYICPGQLIWWGPWSVLTQCHQHSCQGPNCMLSSWHVVQRLPVDYTSLWWSFEAIDWLIGGVQGIINPWRGSIYTAYQDLWYWSSGLAVPLSDIFISVATAYIMTMMVVSKTSSLHSVMFSTLITFMLQVTTPFFDWHSRKNSVNIGQGHSQTVSYRI